MNNIRFDVIVLYTALVLLTWCALGTTNLGNPPLNIKHPAEGIFYRAEELLGEFAFPKQKRGKKKKKLR